jgi:hypothetical protein
VFTEHYRQPVSELSVIAYAEDLADLTAEQLDEACKEARRTSEFMPVSATIRAAHEKMRATGSIYLGPPMLAYNETLTPEEREATVMECREKFKAAMQEHLESKKSTPPKLKKIPVSATPPRSIEEQKAELRRKGFLK